MGFYSTFYVWWVYFCHFFFWLLVYLIAIVITYWCYWTIKYVWQYILMTCSTNTYNDFFHRIHGLNLDMGFLNFFKNLFFNFFFFSLSPEASIAERHEDVESGTEHSIFICVYLSYVMLFLRRSIMIDKFLYNILFFLL